MRRESLVFGILLACASLTFAQTRQQLDNGWEFYQGQLGSTWEIWRGEKAADNITWQPVALPHCFNARDSVDPDVPYYQGLGWYRTRLKVENPFPNGRTLLHFDGAGFEAEVGDGGDGRGHYSSLPRRREPRVLLYSCWVPAFAWMTKTSDAGDRLPPSSAERG